jgi:hypothetical protein
MNLVVIGLNSAKAIHKVVSSSFDSINIRLYDRMDQFIDESEIRRFSVDRLLLSQDSIEAIDDDMIDDHLKIFFNFISTYYQETRVLILCKDQSMGARVSDIFFAPTNMTLVINKSTVKLVEDIVSLDLDKIRNIYPNMVVTRENDLIEMDVLSDDDDAETPVEAAPVQKGKKTKGTSVIDSGGAKSASKGKGFSIGKFGSKTKPIQEEQPVESKKEEKQGFFSRLGKKRAPVQKPQEEPSLPEMNLISKEESILTGIEQDLVNMDFGVPSSGFSFDDNNDVFRAIESNQFTMDVEEDEEVSVDFSDVIDDGIDDSAEVVVSEGSVEFNEDSEKDLHSGFDVGFEEEVESQSVVLDDGDELEDTSPILLEYDEQEETEIEEKLIEDVEKVTVIGEDDIPELDINIVGEELDLNFDREEDLEDIESPISSVNIETDEDENVVEEDTTVKDFQARREELQDKIKDARLEQPSFVVIDDGFDDKKVQETKQEETALIVDVEDLDENFDLFGVEEAYEDANKPVKIVEREVVKIIEVDKSKGETVAQNKLARIMAGKEIAYVIVTGDRRSGVTTTALNMAKFFGKSVKTLFVDFDFDRRGSLLYLGVEDIVEYEEHKQNALGLCKNQKMLKEMAITTKGGFDICISMYGYVLEKDRCDIMQDVLVTQRDYGVVIMDVPLSMLSRMEKIMMRSKVLLCVESNVTAVVNTLLSLSDFTISRLAPLLFDRAKFGLTKYDKDVEFKSLLDYVKSYFDSEDDQIDWTSLTYAGGVNNSSLLVKNIFVD